jgi:hypothetical protein
MTKSRGDWRLLSFDAQSFIFQFTIQKSKIYRTIIFPVSLYGSAAWSLTLREERRSRTFDNRALRRISGPKRDVVTDEWRRLHNEEFFSVRFTKYHSGDQMKKTERGRKCSKYGNLFYLRKPERWRPLGWPRHRWENNIKMVFSYGMAAWTESIWVRIWTDGELL